MYEKYKSPRKKDTDNKKDNVILKFKNIKSKKDIKVEDIVPDQVLLGLIEGTITGPLIKFPKKYADVSLIKEIEIIKKNISLFKDNNS